MIKMTAFDNSRILSVKNLTIFDNRTQSDKIYKHIFEQRHDKICCLCMQ